MNIFAAAVIISLVGEFATQLCAHQFSLRSLRRIPAEEVVGVLDEQRFRQLQRYVAGGTRLWVLSEISYLVVLFVFWFSGGFRELSNLSLGWGFRPVWTSLLQIGMAGLGRAIVALPFTFYYTFGIEARFGFNKTTLPVFVLDLLKTAVLAVAIGGPLGAAVLTVLSEAGRFGWIYAWMIVAAVSLLLQVAAPRVILPWFNHFEPLEEPQTIEAISSYAASVTFPLSAINVMDGSARSSKTNAFLTGVGSNRRLVLYDTLLKRHSIPELVAMVAHEVGHYKGNHIPLRVSLWILQLGVFFALLSLCLKAPGLFQAFYVNRPTVGLGIVLFILLYSPLNFAWGVLGNWIARRQEYAADRFAAETTRHPEALVEALRKLAADNLSQLAPHRLDVVLNYSHPPLNDRILALEGSTTRG